MRPTFFRRARAASALLLVPFAAACANYPKPASPVPAQLTDMEAARMADAYTTPIVGTGRTTTAIRPDPNGWLVSYVTDATADGRPPKESHLVSVRTNGTVRELVFREGK